MDRERLSELLRLHYSGNASAAQERELAGLLEALPDEELSGLLQMLWNEGEAGQFELSPSLRQKLMEQVRETPLVRLQGGKRRLWISVAAAAVIIFFSVAAIMLLRPGSREVAAGAAPVRIMHDLSPGGDKAILTLADGRQVVLDSTRNGAFAKQGSVTVVKTDGELAYTGQGQEGVKEVLYNTVRTPLGGQYRLVLADGTRVWLNAASSLRFPTAFAGHERQVEITGEVYFEVAHDAAHPFIMRRGDTEVKVLGTRFNVNGYDDEPAMRVTLVQGSVAVRRGNEMELLKPGQQALVPAGTSRITVREGVDVEHITSWKEGLFDFYDDGLPVVMRQLSRWYKAEVSYRGPVPEGHYTGAIRRQANLSEVLKMLETAGGVQFTIEGNRIIVEKKA